MFSFLYSEKKKMRQTADNWLETADRVYHYRRDQLTEAQAAKLQSAVSELKLQLKEQAETGRIETAVDSLESVLRDVGGRVYPVSSITENVEFFLVAAIVILGLRAYFLQPFKIPTNSMWPSYYGMTAEVFPPGEEPGLARKVARTVALGASNYSVTAPLDGEVSIPVFENLSPAFTEKAGRSMLVFPASLREYSFAVGDQVMPIAVPAEWAQSGNFDEVVQEVFFKNGATSLTLALNNAAIKRRPLRQSTLAVQLNDRQIEARVFWIPTGRQVKKGEKLFSFDILTGDLLFVDRFTYNFFPPAVGSGFVFKTENIHSKNMEDAKGRQIQQYYIKRLVGVPGDTLEARPPALWRNGQPITGASAFQKNAQREELYPGYSYANKNYGIEFLTGPGETVTVPPKSFFAMGDNSPKSQDSRYWGFVPDKEVVGRPMFIYYPLTKRWGPAR